MSLTPCHFCGYEFDEECGKYGCPNCHGEGLENMENIKLNKLTRGELGALRHNLVLYSYDKKQVAAIDKILFKKHKYEKTQLHTR